jgi:hypothetical protein
MWSVVSDGALSLRDPFFIIGAPRSGTTYLHEVLNRHPEVFLTNETRVMIFVNRALNILGGNRENLLTYRGEFLDFLRRMMPPLIEAFYRELGAPEDSVWGGKYGNYGDGLRDRQCLGAIASASIRSICSFPTVASSISSATREAWSPRSSRRAGRISRPASICGNGTSCTRRASAAVSARTASSRCSTTIWSATR